MDINQFIGEYGATASTVEKSYALSAIYGHVERTGSSTRRSGAEDDVTDITSGGAVKWSYLYSASEIYGEDAKSKTVLPFKVEDRTDGGTAIWATVEDGLPVPATLKNAKKNGSQTQ